MIRTIDLGAFGRHDVDVVGYPADGKVAVRFKNAPAGDPPTIVQRHHLVDQDLLPSAAPTARSQAELGMMTERQYKVLRALYNAGSNGLLDDDHLELCGMPSTSSGKRRVELLRRGYVAAAPKPNDRRLTRWKTMATVWVITPAGREALLAHEQLLQPA